MCGVLDVPLRAAGFNPHCARGGVDSDALQAREIDDQSVVTAAEAGPVMPASANRDEQVLLAPEIHGSDDVGCVRAARDEARPFIDHRVVKLASVMISLIFGL